LTANFELLPLVITVNDITLVEVGPGVYEYEVPIDVCNVNISVQNGTYALKAGTPRYGKREYDISIGGTVIRWDYRYTVKDPSGIYSYEWLEYPSSNPVATSQSFVIPQSGDYSVRVTSSAGVLRSCILNVKKADVNATLKAYPNPVVAGQSFYVEADVAEELFDGAMLDIFDQSGRHIQTIPVRSRVVELDGRYNSGVYIIVFRGKDNFQIDVKLVID